MDNYFEANPFSTKFWTPGQIAYRFDEDGFDAETLIGKMTASTMQIVGQHGSGKSTLLRTLARYWERRGKTVRLETLNDQKRRLPNDFIPAQNTSAVYLLDGFEQLSFSDRLRLRLRFRCQRGVLLLTTHRPAFGIPILYRTVPKFEIFENLVRQLTQSQPIAVEESMLRNIYDNADGNFRTAFFELYDHLQNKGAGSKAVLRVTSG